MFYNRRVFNFFLFFIKVILILQLKMLIRLKKKKLFCYKNNFSV